MRVGRNGWFGVGEPHTLVLRDQRRDRGGQVQLRRRRRRRVRALWRRLRRRLLLTAAQVRRDVGRHLGFHSPPPHSCSHHRGAARPAHT